MVNIIITSGTRNMHFLEYDLVNEAQMANPFRTP